MMRTLARIGTRPPTAVYSRSCSTRSKRVCASGGMSPISSRNSVPPFACSKRPILRAVAPVKAPFSWPNSSLSISSRGIAAILIATNGAERRLPKSCSARDQLLTGAAFAGDHDREVGSHQPGDGAIDLLHCRRAADQRQLPVIDFVLRPCRSRWRTQGPLDDADQLAQIEGLREVFEGAALGRLNRCQERALCAHDNDPQLRPHLLDAGDHVEAVLVRHDDIGD